MPTAKVSVDVNLNADKLFSNLGDFTGIKLEGIKSIKTSGSGVGALRDIVTGAGARVLERCDNYDSNSRTLTYSIINDDHPLPFRYYVATLIVTPVGAESCRVDWWSNFDVKSGTEEDALKMARGIYTGLIKNAQKQLAA
ncbi:MAG: SRPBCC family protein [Alphaproteobacteria bacterium]|nr:SRPBCC family protein [Alphaproteobacteria bacterium]